jgi:hypothetical protein
MSTRQAALAALRADKPKVTVEVEEETIGKMKVEAKEEGKRAGKQEALEEIMVAKHVQEQDEARRQEAWAGAGTESKRGRGRPKKSAGPAPSPARAMPSLATNTPASNEWTLKGRRNKRKCLAMHARLAGRLQGAPPMPVQDTDTVWAEYLKDISEILGESAAEVNVKALFISTLDAYDRHAQMGGRLNPLGWDTRGLVQFATTETEWKVFDDDLVELSILYQEWFSSGPVVRLAGNTVKLINKVNAYHVQEQSQAQAATASADDQEKFKDL